MSEYVIRDYLAYLVLAHYLLTPIDGSLIKSPCTDLCSLQSISEYQVSQLLSVTISDMRAIEDTRALSTIDPELDQVRIIHISKVPLDINLYGAVTQEWV